MWSEDLIQAVLYISVELVESNIMFDKVLLVVLS